LVHARDPLIVPALTALAPTTVTATTAETAGGDRKLKTDGERRGKEA